MKILGQKLSDALDSSVCELAVLYRGMDFIITNGKYSHRISIGKMKDIERIGLTKEQIELEEWLPVVSVSELILRYNEYLQKEIGRDKG